MELFIELYQLYQSKPCFWYVKGKNYHDRAKRDAAYKKLVDKLKKFEPDAVKYTVVKKINSMILFHKTIFTPYFTFLVMFFFFFYKL